MKIFLITVLVWSCRLINTSQTGSNSEKIKRINRQTDPGNLSERYSYMVSIQSYVGNTPYHSCAGTIIGHGIILTSCFCYAKLTRNVTIHIGSHIWSKNNGVGHIQRPKFRYAITHMNRSCNYDDCITVIFVEWFEYTKTIQPANLPAKDADILGKKFYFAGWGSHKKRRLSHTHLVVQGRANQELEATGPFKTIPCTEYGDRVSEKMFCTETKNAKLCQGDEGGALVEPENRVILGILLYTVDCNKRPAVFLNIIYYVDYINQFIIDSSTRQAAIKQDVIPELPEDYNNGSIYQGKSIQLINQPFQVALKYHQPGNDVWEDVQYECGGSIINKRMVLTAATCVTLMFQRSSKRSATNSLPFIIVHNFSRREMRRSEPKGVNIKKHDAVGIRIHPRFQSGQYHYNVAIVESINDLYASPMSMLPIQMNFVPIPDATDLIANVTGWTSGDNAYQYLYAETQILEQSLCQGTRYYRKTITDEMVCAELNERMCVNIRTAIGSPLVKEGKQIAVLSHGNNCNSGCPLVFIRISAISNWIQDNFT